MTGTTFSHVNGNSQDFLKEQSNILAHEMMVPSAPKG